MLFFFWIPVLIGTQQLKLWSFTSLTILSFLEVVLLYGAYATIPVVWDGIHEAFDYCLPLIQGRFAA